MIKNIGRYQIQGEIGKGGFGKVYRAWDPTVNRQVAIKILTVQGDDDILTRFRNEAASAGNLRHKNIVTIHDFGEHEGTPYMVMQLLEGENLQDIIARGRPLTLLDKVNIMQEVAEGLHAAHQHGIVHRDVKPANIMILPDDSVQIMDFGIARITASAASRQTRTGFVIGTVLYMAPEQFLPNMEVDYRADIWAYGVIYYELLTGKHPFAAPEQTSTLYQIAHADPPPLNSLAPDCPPALAEVVQRALMKDREFRYQSLKELQFDVQPILLDLKRERAGELMNAARDLADSGQIDQANVALQHILDLDQTNRDAHNLLAAVKQQLHRRNVQPRIDGLVKRAEEFVAVRNYRQAVESIEAALRLSQTDTSLRARLDQIRALQEEAPKADRLLNEAKQQLDAQNLTGAFRAASEALDTDPENSRANQLISMIHGEMERRDNRRKLDEGLNRAKTLVLLQTYDEAIAVLSDLAASNPDEPAIVELLENAEREKTHQGRRGRKWRELSAVREAIQARQFETAISQLETVQSEFPGDPEIDQLLRFAREEFATSKRAEAIDRGVREVRRLVDSGSFDDALRAVEQALALCPGDATLERLRQSTAAAMNPQERRMSVEECVHLCERLRSEGKVEEALRCLDSAMLESPEEPRLLDLQALLQREYEAWREIEALARETPRKQAGEATQKADVSAPPAPANEPGEFTEMFRAPAQEPVTPKVPAPPDKPGFFTRMFRSPTPGPAKPEVSGPSAAPSFTEMFSAPAQPASGSASHASTVVQPLPTYEDLIAPKPTKPVPPPPAAPDATVLMPAGGTNTVLCILETVNPSMVGRTVPLPVLPFSIGRAECDLSLPDDIGLSRRHATIDLKNGSFVIRDLDSKNGTFVNGKPLSSQSDEPLPFGAAIRLSGGTTLTFQAQHIKPMPDLCGLLAGNRYKLTTMVHTSNKAATYLAEDTDLGCTVAVKILSPQLARYPGYAEEFRNQAVTAASLRHPHICKIYHFGVVDIPSGGQSLRANYLCMDYMEGGSLAKKLAAGQSIAPESIGRWLQIVGEALDYAHQKGVVHAGLKPAAIVFDERDTPYVTDFAIASRAGDEKKWAVMGVPAFLAPEQWEGQLPTGKSDQFSLAVLAYLLLTGSRPYEGQENPEVRRRNFARGPIPAHDEAHHNGRAGITRVVSSVLARGMSTKPEARYASVTEFAAALATALDPRERPVVFISYHRKTCAIPAIHFKEKLSSNHGINSFVDVERVDNAQRFPDRLRQAIEECDLFVCLLGPETLASKWVKEEISIAHKNGKPMVPVFEEGFSWPDPGGLEPHIGALLHHEGLELRVRRPDQVDEVISDLAHMVRNTIG